MHLLLLDKLTNCNLIEGRKMLERDETIRISRRLRAAINLDQGIIDIKMCLRIADELEKAGSFLNKKGTNYPNYRARRSFKNRNGVTPAFTAQDLYEIFDLESLKDGLLIEELMKSSEGILTIKNAAGILGLSECEVQSKIRDLRFHFSKLGFGRVVSNKRGGGYFMSDSARYDIYDFISSWRKYFLPKS